ncbi:MAG: low molecular weight protein-tyrosine-phosphatase [Marinagarivorans sp.]|nr:low molecular weight protein-tyrosine-phosphatase [Marinagarivorans sp.]
MTINVLFVCLGNICRSPTAHGVFQKIIDDRGLNNRISVDSAGTAGWHTGKSPDARSQRFAKKRGYDLSDLRARQAIATDFDEFDLILAMDKQNLKDLQALCPSHFAGRLDLFLAFGGSELSEVPDPYYEGDDGFEKVLDLVEDACQGLLDHLLSKKA